MEKTIIILGSSRKNGNTAKLAGDIATRLKAEIIYLGDKKISYYDYEHKNINDDFLDIMKKVRESTHIIFASPVYWYSMSAQMKVFIDRLSDFLSINDLKKDGRSLAGKAAYLAATSISENIDDSFVSPFKKTFSYFGIQYSGLIHVDFSDNYEEHIYLTDIDIFIKNMEINTLRV